MKLLSLILFELRSGLFLCILIHSIKLMSEARDICSCAPLVYEWRLDFEKRCLPTNITVGPNQGIVDVFCSIESIQPSSTTTSSTTPVKVTAYQIIELDMMLTPLKSNSASETDLQDGDLITFTSMTASDKSILSGGFQVSLLGQNSNQEEIILKWLVRYSNICEQNPFYIGDSIGWLVYSGGIPSRPETCLFPSSAPSLRPSTSITSNPSSNQSNQPTNFPSKLTSFSPSSAPSKSPSVSITSNPSSNQSNQPSYVPSHPPSLTATESKTETASSNPSSITMYPSTQPSSSSSLRKSELPSILPSLSSTKPTFTPTNYLSQKPTSTPSLRPIRKLSHPPSLAPSIRLNKKPTDFPSASPTDFSFSYSFSVPDSKDDLSLWLNDYEYITEFGQKGKLSKRQHV